MKPTVPEKYWIPEKGRFEAYDHFGAYILTHISYNSALSSCDLQLVGCSDGRWYIEDGLGGEAGGHTDVFNPFSKTSYPTFFPDEEAAIERATQIICIQTGCEHSDVEIEF